MVAPPVEPLAVFRQPVLHPGRKAVTLLFLNQTVIGQLLQTVSKHFLADALHYRKHVLETSLPTEDSRQNLHVPLRPQHVHRVRYRHHLMAKHRGVFLPNSVQHVIKFVVHNQISIVAPHEKA